jgi:hypothetical protein
MPYSNFSLKKASTELGVSVTETQGIFDGLATIEPSDILKILLEDQVPLAVSINTEKARSELIVSSILVELRRRYRNRVSLFSGIEFNVDKDRDLNGYCDFIIGGTPQQLALAAPIIAVVEAKNENLIGGLGQCIAEMVAAKLFNAQERNPMERVYGAVTSGTVWQFLRLQGSAVEVDLQEYFIDRPGKILGILSAMVEQAA